MFALVKAGAVLQYSDVAPNVDQSLLADGKPRWLPVETANETFDEVSEVREGPDVIVEAARVVHSYTVREKNEDEIAAMRADKIDAIKAEAQARISAVITGTRSTSFDRLLVTELNMTARGVELANKGASRTSDELAESSALQAVWDAVKAIRTRSNELEASLAANDPAAIDAFDVAQGWD
jgi:hypothetical protein